MEILMNTKDCPINHSVAKDKRYMKERFSRKHFKFFPVLDSSFSSFGLGKRTSNLRGTAGEWGGGGKRGG